MEERFRGLDPAGVPAPSVAWTLVPYEAIPTRFARVVGWVGSSTLWYGTPDSCRPGLNHRIHHELRRGTGPAPDDAHEGWNDWIPEIGTPCDDCGSPWPGVDQLDDEHWSHSGGTTSVWDTPSGKLEPGSLWWNEYMPHEGPRCVFYGWGNCDGRHLMAMTPNGHSWDVDARASNCGLPVKDTRCPENPETGEHAETCACRVHRCWVRTGNPEAEPPTVHVDKNGFTCAAGGGSIVAGDYHGHLHAGSFTGG